MSCRFGFSEYLQGLVMGKTAKEHRRNKKEEGEKKKNNQGESLTHDLGNHQQRFQLRHQKLEEETQLM